MASPSTIISTVKTRIINLCQHPSVQQYKGIACESLHKGKQVSHQFLGKGLDIGKNYTQAVQKAWKSSPMYEHKYVAAARTVGSQYWDLTRAKWTVLDSFASREAKKAKEILQKKSVDCSKFTKEKSSTLLHLSKQYGSKYAMLAWNESAMLLHRTEAFVLGPVRNWYLISKHLLAQVIIMQELAPPSISSWPQAKAAYKEIFQRATTNNVLDYTWGQISRTALLIVELCGFYYVGQFLGVGLRKAVSP